MCLTIIWVTTKSFLMTILDIFSEKSCTEDILLIIGTEGPMKPILRYSLDLKSCKTWTLSQDLLIDPQTHTKLVMKTIDYTLKRNFPLNLPLLSVSTLTPKLVIWLTNVIPSSRPLLRSKEEEEAEAPLRVTVLSKLWWILRTESLLISTCLNYKTNYQKMLLLISLCAYKNAKEWTNFWEKSRPVSKNLDSD
jgi:hypothetical protein